MKQHKKALLATCLVASLALGVLAGCSAPHEHDYGDWKVTTLPGESSTGVAERTCTACDDGEVGHTQSISLPALTDPAYTKSADTATCTARGYVTYSYTVNGNNLSFKVSTPMKAHAFGAWVEGTPSDETTRGEVGHYYCENCKQYFDAEHNLIESDNLVLYATTLTEDAQIRFTSTYGTSEGASIVGEKMLYDGVTTAGSTEKVVYFSQSSKSLNDEKFTHCLKLGGKMNADTRYIRLKTDSACNVTFYAVPGKTDKGGRDLVLSPAADLDQEITTCHLPPEITPLKALSFTITTAGTWYFGSVTGGIDVYGIDVTMTSETHHYSDEWSFDETNHWHTCTDDGCSETADINAHSWGEGTVVDEATADKEGSILYTCTVCGKTKTETIPKVVISSDVTVRFDDLSTGSKTENIAAYQGIVFTATTEKTISVDSKSATYEDLSFTKAIQLGGKANVDSRHIAVSVDRACTVVIYVMKNKGSSFAMAALPESIETTSENVTSLTSSIQAIEYNIAAGGTYYFGMQSSSCWVFGIDVTFPAA